MTVYEISQQDHSAEQLYPAFESVRIFKITTTSKNKTGEGFYLNMQTDRKAG